MNIKHTTPKISALLLLISFFSARQLHAIDSQQRNCIILVDHTDCENIGDPSFYLMSKIQSAIAEQSTPLLMSISLWNAFIERRISVEQSLKQKNTPLYKVHNLYQAINKQIEHLSHHYNALSHDAAHNKKLIIQCINKEFYNNKHNISAANYQRLLNYHTYFDPQDWDIYENNGGFYLFIPKKYSAQHSLIGFNLDSLAKVADPQDSSYIYFESRVKKSIIDALPDFFLTHDNFNNENMPYAWNIVLAGHGGSRYSETNDDDTITWIGEPSIANLTVQEFDDMLTFLQSSIKTNLFYYSSCYAGGNHISLMFNDTQKNSYNFAIICETLTDCTSYSNWTTLLPCDEKKFLTTADMVYDQTKECWQLPLSPVYHWADFFKAVGSINFSIGSIEKLEKLIYFINYRAIANIPILRLPEAKDFFPLQLPDVIKIDDQLVALGQREDDCITLNGIRTVLVESVCIIPTIELNHFNPLRIISIKPGHAIHYIKKLKSTYYIDLPTVFWQAQYQRYNKTFILDECTFPYSYVLKDIIAPQENDLVLKNVMIIQQKNNHIRIFGTLNDKAMMIIAHKPVEENAHATIQEVVMMSPDGQKKYEENYLLLKTAALNQSTT